MGKITDIKKYNEIKIKWNHKKYRFSLHNVSFVFLGRWINITGSLNEQKMQILGWVHVLDF